MPLHLASSGRTSVIPLIAGAAVLGALFNAQGLLLYDPDEDMPARPAEAGLPEMRIVDTLASDMVFVECWFAPPKGEKPTVLYCHGRTGNIARETARARLILDQGYGLLLQGYRGYGRNSGYPTERGLKADAKGGLDFLIRQAGIPAERIVLYGRSLGTAVLAPLAADRRLAGILFETPFDSILHLAEAAQPTLPLGLFIGEPYDSLPHAARFKAPFVILHGTEDEFIPAENVLNLFAVAPEPKRLCWIPGGRHCDLMELGGAAKVTGFLDIVS
jgi:alpha-beta hydrolase superfamily lysophospholipase